MPRRQSFFRRFYRAIVGAGCAVVAAAATLAVGGSVVLDGLFFDLALAHRAFLTGGPAPREAPVAIIAVDQRSLDAEQLRVLPRALFAPHWAQLIDTTIEAGARAIGFDIIFAWSGNALQSNLDQPFLAALGKHGRQVVLARSTRMMPATPYYYAVGAGADPGALGIVELLPDGDGVVRRLGAAIEAEGQRHPGFAAALLARAGAPAMPDKVLIAPRHQLETLPTYSMIDVLHCAERDRAALAAAFKGKIILVGTTLAEEDRRVAADRFLAPAVKPSKPFAAAAGCALEPRGASDPDTSTVPAIFVHAAAVAAVASGTLTKTVPTGVVALTAAGFAAIGAWAGLTLGTWLAIGGAFAALLALFLIKTGLLAVDLWLPITLPMLAIVNSVVLAYVVRYLFEDRKRRRIQHAFAHYLSPALVDRLSEDDEDLRLGGETREITVMFADLSGFTALSDKVAPDVLTAVTNRYLGYIVEAVDATGGYVEKFIGDAVMAMWGAPVADADHPFHAVKAAQAAVARVMAEFAAAKARGEVGFAVKIGVNSGPATVGNVGAGKRYNYSAMGISVNLAARLESVPEDYGCRLVIGEATAAAIADRYLLCELDWIKVKGKEKAVAVFEPICELANATEAQKRYVAAFGAALAHYRAGRFVDARDAWRALDYAVIGEGKEGGPPAAMARRAEAFVAAPPEGEWDGVFVRRTK